MGKINSDLNTEIKLFKENIEYLISSGDLENSKKLIAEFQLIKDKDIEIQNMKAIISIMENSLDDAERFLWEAVGIESDSPDTLFNLAYLYEIKAELEKSVNFYRQAYQKTENLERKFQIKQILSHFEDVEFPIERKFIVLSSCPWGVMLQRPHQIARALSKLGYKIDYIQPSIEVEASNEKVTNDELMKFSEDHIRQYELIKIHNPVSAYYKENYLLNNYSNIVQDIINESDEEVILICYLPSQVNIINQLSGRFKVVYECVDDHSDLEHSYWSNKQDREYEIQILDRADVITTTSNALYLTKSIQNKNNNVYLSKNAVNVEDFTRYEETILPDDLLEIPSPRICYIGAVDSWFDKELFYELVRTNKDKSFVVIGPVREGILNEKEDNLYILGLKEHRELKSYLKFMDIGIVPFKDNTDIIINCDPIKMYEYVMSGLPVIATNMPELILNRSFIKTCKNINEWNSVITHFINFKLPKDEMREFIHDNTWAMRSIQMINLIDDRTDQYNRDSILKKMRINWETAIDDNAVLLSMYSLLIGESDKVRALMLAEQAYSEVGIYYTFKNYMKLLILNDELSTAAQVVLNYEGIDKKYKAELIYAKENGKDILVRLLYCINDFHGIYNYLNDKRDYNESIDYANYLFEVGNLNKALQIYWNNSFNNYLVHDSPLSSVNIAYLLELSKNNRYSYFEERYELLCKKYLEYEKDHRENESGNLRITILIVTRNRPSLLERCLLYFSGFRNITLNIRVLDGSDTYEKGINLELLQKNNFKNVIYSHFDSSSSPIDRISHILPEIEDEYCAVCADDDFIAEEGIISSIKIMEANMEIVTVKGRSYVYKNNNISEIFEFPKDCCERLIEDSPVNRISKLTKNWVPQLIYSVFRKDTLKIVTNLLTKEEVRSLPFVFIEYLWYFAIPLIGKVENMDIPLNIRDFSMDSEGHVAWGFANYIEEDSFNEKYEVFKSALVSLFENSEQADELDECMDQIMDSFLDNSWGLKERFVVNL
ncbi:MULTISPECIES: TIGR00180 family glycosyltransferase [Paenibacillus]|uniref:TIGR00180 family glycosyltransferase n=1 Tax=Paenibacillus TaxID=44249 RepID=UPI000B8492DE|nr:TIGR00180 family glycosyltransferase [Paenibacillus amylolyticus]